MPRARLTTFTEPALTSLPGSPVDGQIINFLADATKGIVWRLRYRAGSSSSYKWEFVGGQAVQADVTTLESKAGNGSFADLTTVGPSVTIPLSGEYEVMWGAGGYSSVNASELYVQLAVNGTGTGEIAWINAYGQVNSSGTRRVSSKALAAGNVVKLLYGGNATGGTHSYRDRWLMLKPIRVG